MKTEKRAFLKRALALVEASESNLIIQLYVIFADGEYRYDALHLEIKPLKQQ